MPCLLALLALLLLLAPSLCDLSAALAASGDVAGSKDYSGIGRFAGSVITGYQVKDFDATRLQAAAFKDGKATDGAGPEGRITRIADADGTKLRKSRSAAAGRVIVSLANLQSLGN